ncbi:hypothetical protein [Marinivivus vitaminiproducens]|uniref:hypothetical protein n=1 Tax=Marinivivus vitaminiproducens TaxID=3035935 RepID=UPI0027A8B531|nr:hypothetical protein P4R82_11775 [Geminicoccaceae bacterium SCSIO 64248]
MKNFLTDCCVTDWRSELPAEQLDVAYKRWCWSQGEKPLSLAHLADGLSRVGYVRARRPDGWIWGGVRLTKLSA